MSAEQVRSDQGTLVVDAVLGSTIRISNGLGREIFSGTGEVRLKVDPGLYAVRWTFADSSEQVLVEVLPGQEVPCRPARREQSEAREATALAVAEIPVSLQFLESTRRWDKSDLVVTVEGDRDFPVGDVLETVQLVKDSTQLVPAPDHKLRPTVAVRSWSEATAGRYRLRFRANSGGILDLAVPVFRDRRTIVRLFASEASLLVPDGERFTTTQTLGIDPSRSVVASVRPDCSPVEMNDGLGLAGLLLRDLAKGTGSLTDAFAARLQAPGTDPLLKLLAAMVVINCLERDIAPAFDEPFPAETDAVQGYRTRWLAVASGWIGDPRTTGMPPDATTGLWQIEALEQQEQVNQASGRAPRSIQTPPMLECAWRWAVARSTLDRQALQAFASIRAAARSGGGTTPFLCWQASAAKGINRRIGAPPTETLDGLVREIADKMRQVREQDRAKTPHPMVPRGVPPEAAAIALRAEELVDREARNDPINEGPSLAGALAVSLTVPQPALGGRLEQALSLLDQTLAAHVRLNSGKKLSQDTRDAPGWSAKILRKKDLNFGRFGGQSSREGFRLAAEFKVSKSSKDWASIFLSIEGLVPDGTLAVFYLHNSYASPRREVSFKDGEARLKVTAWGGFTVGAWIPSRDVELELNLAKVDGAPRMIRER